MTEIPKHHVRQELAPRVVNRLSKQWKDESLDVRERTADSTNNPYYPALQAACDKRDLTAKQLTKALQFYIEAGVLPSSAVRSYLNS